MIATALSWGKWLLGLALGWSDKQADRAVEVAREETKRIEVGGEVVKAGIAGQTAVITTGMNFWPFWVAWSLAAVPCCAWFGLGMLDSALNGRGPDVSALPPQLAAVADQVFNSIFYSGVGLGATQAVTKVATTALAAWGQRR